MVKLEDVVVGRLRNFKFLKVHEEFNEETQKKYYIYEMYSLELDRAVGFEVLTPNIRKEPQRMPNGQIQPPGEVYPGNEDFGKNALSISMFNDTYEVTLARAKRALNQLIERDKENSVIQQTKKQNAITRTSERESAKNSRRKK